METERRMGVDEVATHNADLARQHEKAGHLLRLSTELFWYMENYGDNSDRHLRRLQTEVLYELADTTQHLSERRFMHAGESA